MLYQDTLSDLVRTKLILMDKLVKLHNNSTERNVQEEKKLIDEIDAIDVAYKLVEKYIYSTGS